MLVHGELKNSSFVVFVWTRVCDWRVFLWTLVCVCTCLDALLFRALQEADCHPIQISITLLSVSSEVFNH